MPPVMLVTSTPTAGFGGLRIQAGRLRIDLALPPGIRRLSFRLGWQGQRLCVRVDHDELVLEAPDGPVRLSLDGEPGAVTSDVPLRRPLGKRGNRCCRAPQRPPGREPPRVDGTWSTSTNTFESST